MGKMNDCLEVCTKSNGCNIDGGTHRICKLNSPYSYNKQNFYYINTICIIQFHYLVNLIMTHVVNVI